MRLSTVAAPAPQLTSYRFWERYSKDQLSTIRERIGTVLDDMDRQFGLFVEEAAAQAAPAPNVTTEASKAQSALGAVLSPSQVNMYLNCSAKWWFKHGLGLPDPASGNLVRGRVVHRMAELYYGAKLHGAVPEVDDLAGEFDAAWETEASKASFQADDDIEQLKRQAAVLSRKYIDEVASEIQPAKIELPVTGAIAGVPVRGIVDLIDATGRIIDLKTKGQTPSGIEPDYRLQLATYRQLAPGVSGEARLDVLVPNKTPKLVTFPHTVSVADQIMTQHLYPHVREGIREGLYFPNRCSHLCSRKYCNFADACEKEFGGKVE